MGHHHTKAISDGLKLGSSEAGKTMAKWRWGKVAATITGTGIIATGTTASVVTTATVASVLAPPLFVAAAGAAVGASIWGIGYGIYSMIGSLSKN